MTGSVSLTAENVAVLEMLAYFWISSVFALNSCTDLISVCVHLVGRQCCACHTHSRERAF